MISIKMQANSTVTYEKKCKIDDCLLVENYQYENDIWHLPLQYKNIGNYKSYVSVGCWRIKQQKLNH